jgi:hypothetical protein
MEETKKQDALEKIKSGAQIKFEASITTAIELKEQAIAIVITDENTLAQANQILSKMNTHLKETKAKGLALRKPYNDAAGIIIDFEKLVTGPLDEGLKTGKEKLKAWNDAELQKAAAAREEIEKQKKFFDDVISQLQQKIDQCKTVKECDDLQVSILEKWPESTKFGPYHGEAEINKKVFIDLLKAKLQAFTIGISESKVNKITEQAMKMVNEISAATAEKQAEATASISNNIVKGSTRKTPKYEIFDESKLPREWLMPDPDKIKEHLMAIKSTLELSNKAVEHHGVKFYIDNTVIVR